MKKSPGFSKVEVGKPFLFCIISSSSSREVKERKAGKCVVGGREGERGSPGLAKWN